eukprot:597739-Amphidinium_carterae.1
MAGRTMPMLPRNMKNATRKSNGLASFSLTRFDLFCFQESVSLARISLLRTSLTHQMLRPQPVA